MRFYVKAIMELDKPKFSKLKVTDKKICNLDDLVTGKNTPLLERLSL